MTLIVLDKLIPREWRSFICYQQTKRYVGSPCWNQVISKSQGLIAMTVTVPVKLVPGVNSSCLITVVQTWRIKRNYYLFLSNNVFLWILRNFNPKTAGGGQFEPPPPVVFPKIYLLKRVWNPVFLWLLVLS